MECKFVEPIPPLPTSSGTLTQCIMKINNPWKAVRKMNRIWKVVRTTRLSIPSVAGIPNPHPRPSKRERVTAMINRCLRWVFIPLEMVWTSLFFCFLISVAMTMMNMMQLKMYIMAKGTSTPT